MGNPELKLWSVVILRTAASTGSVWGHPPEAHAAPVVPPPVGVPRSMMASSGPAWGGAGLPDARKVLCPLH